MACIWGYILTLIAFVRSFSTVRFQMCFEISCPREGKITVATFVWLFSTVGFQMSPQMACLSECKVALVACVLLFSTVRFQMSPETALHCSHLLHCIHIYCIALHLFGFLHCALPNVSSKRLHEKRQSHIGCICLTFLHCAFSNDSPNCFTLFTFVAFVWFFSTVRCQMCPQNVSTRRGKVTLVAFVGLFSTVRFQMCPQSTCRRGCILTLAAFIWLVSTVHFHIYVELQDQWNGQYFFS